VAKNDHHLFLILFGINFQLAFPITLVQIALIQLDDVVKLQTNTPENAMETFVKVDFDLPNAKQVRYLLKSTF